MRGQPGVLRVALSFALLLAALSWVVWRQSRALEALRSLDEVRGAQAVAEAERAELVRRIQALESRGRVVSAAAERLNMRLPAGAELVILPWRPAPVAEAGR